MKKLALALVAASTFVTAASADLTTGYYLGVGVGGNNMSVPVTIGGNSVNLGRGRFEGSVYGGYGYVSGCTYLGAELGYTFTGGKASLNTALGNSLSIERRNIINAAFLVGQKFSPSTMFYIRLGMNSNQYRFKAVNVVNPALSANENKRKISFAPGFGLEGAVTKNVRVRVQYVYDLGNSVEGTGKIKTQTTTLGVAYKF